jgi:hypothetical protein
MSSYASIDNQIEIRNTAKAHAIQLMSEFEKIRDKFIDESGALRDLHYVPDDMKAHYINKGRTFIEQYNTEYDKYQLYRSMFPMPREQFLERRVFSKTELDLFLPTIHLVQPVQAAPAVGGAGGGRLSRTAAAVPSGNAAGTANWSSFGATPAGSAAAAPSAASSGGKQNPRRSMYRGGKRKTRNRKSKLRVSRTS